MAKRKPPKKGKTQEYDQWTPEYNKSGNLTARSKKRLEAIRAQALSEGIFDDLDELKEIGGFVGLTACFYYGINPAILKIVEAIGGLTDSFNKLFEVDLVPIGEGVEPFSIGVRAGSQKDAEEVVERLKESTKKQKALALVEYQIRERALVKRLEDPELPPELRAQLETQLEAVRAAIDALIAEISAGSLSRSDTASIETKVIMINVLVSMGEAWATECFFKSYEPAEFVENVTITG